LNLVFIHTQTSRETKLFQSQASTIVALTKGCKKADVVESLSEIPEGCGSAVVTPTVVVYILVKVRILFRIKGKS
jgi:valyl-tRNA synthetase